MAQGAVGGAATRVSIKPRPIVISSVGYRNRSDSLLKFLIQAREEGKRVWGYGAPAKGNTLLNYCGIRADLLEATVDRSPHKQGRFLPGYADPDSRAGEAHRCAARLSS